MSSSKAGHSGTAAQRHRKGTGAACSVPLCHCAAVPRLLALALAVAGCSLEEVTIPLGERIIVVQSVLSLDPDALAQYVLVEWSVTGTATIPDQDSLRGPPRPPLPISGADVIVTRDDGDSIRFTEIPDTLGVYRIGWGDMVGFLAPGREYRLRVTVPDGRVVRGRTRMPGTPVVSGLLPDGAPFNRDRDTLHVSWSGAQGSKGVFVQVRPRDVARWVRLVLWTDSTRFTIPGRLAFPLPSDSLPPDVWIAGTRETFTVAAMDTNFFDFFRTANDPFTGSGFANRLEGGLGVFGAMAPVSRTYDVVADIDHPWEGRYRLMTNMAGGSDDTLTLFVTRDAPSPVLIGALGVAADPLGFLAPRFEITGAVESGMRMTWALVVEPPGHPNRQRRGLLTAEAFNPAGITTGLLRDARQSPVGTFTLQRLP